MATKFLALATYRPKIKKGKRADSKDAANLISGRTSATEGSVLESLSELRYTLFFFLRDGFLQVK